MTTENILKRISIIRTGNKKSADVRDLIAIVQKAIEVKPTFEVRDFLEEKLTEACKF